MAVNGLVTKCWAENLSISIDLNNRAQGSYLYDAAGNMLWDNNGTNYLYDAENRISSTAGFTYTYDADGNRVEKVTGTTPPTGTLYWYMTPGIVAESDLSGNLQSEYVFFDGARIARKDFPGNTVSYYFSDHLKTASVITDSVGNIKSELDYYPWGGGLQFANADANHFKFTGKERDSETGLDYFGARYYSNGLGRFVTPDWSAVPVPVPYADLTDPQSLNQYSYVRNIPTSKIDPECPAIERVLEGIAESPAGRAIAEKGAQIAGAIGTGLAAGWAYTSGVAEKAFDVYASACGQGSCVSEFQRTRPDQQNQSSDKSSGQQENSGQGTTGQTNNSNNNGTLPKPPKGKGTVPPSQRDPKRTWTKNENDRKLDQQNGLCPQCGKPVPPGKARGHHIHRHADGGRTNNPNHAVVCDDCHVKDIHK
jgi:RHS repeat-associated protein